MSGDGEHTTFVPEPEPSAFRLIATLGVAGFLSGLVLVSSYLWTKPTIDANKAEAQRQAIFQVLPGTADYETLALQDGQLVVSDEPGQEVVFLGRDSSQAFTGFAITGEEPGFSDIVTVICGYEPVEKAIIGYQVLDCKETPGLGDKIIRNEGFLANFKHLTVDPGIILVKNGTRKQPNEVDGITGATISSRTVVKLLNEAMAKWKEPINNYLQEHPEIKKRNDE
ncbi:MAG: FMN-binding protein [Lewinellaceae bacterium]|nr:FMN-binding protein [Lewinellaceae bacterium]